MKSVLFIFFASLLFFSCKNIEESDFFYNKALELYSKRDFSNAIIFSTKAVNQNKKNGQAKLLKAKSFFFLEEYEKAEKELKNISKKHPGFTEARLWLVRSLLQQEKLDEAEQKLAEEILFNPTDWRFYYQYALLAKYLERNEEVLSFCRKAEEILSDTEKLYLELSELWLLLGVKPNALNELDKAELVSRNPKNIQELKAYIKNGDGNL